MKPTESAYYVTHGRISDPGARAMLLGAMPSDPERLVTAVSRLILHRLFVVPLGITPHPASAADVESQTIARILDRILARDAAPLDVPRPPERRFIGICRDYALLACAVLRHHVVPARARVGFANYFTPNFYEGHWVCECHRGDRWRLLDPELGGRVRAYLKVSFPPSVRRGVLDPATCSLSSEQVALDVQVR